MYKHNQEQKNKKVLTLSQRVTTSCKGLAFPMHCKSAIDSPLESLIDSGAITISGAICR